MRRLFIILTLLFAGTVSAYAQSPYVKAHVLTKEVTGDYGDVYMYEAELEDGNIISFEDFEDGIHVGDTVYLEHLEGSDGYLFTAIQRTPILFGLLGLFVFLILWFTKRKGWFSLLSLILSFVLLLSVFVPFILKGYDPILLAVLLGGGILFLSIFVTHGFSRQSLVSFIGSIASIIVAVVLVELVTKMGSFSGVTDHTSLLLSGVLETPLNFVKIFSASVIIGVLGVLDDITITQVAVVRELAAGSHESREVIFKRALRVGQDHISSLVNTLIFAYVGSSLPLIMFMYQFTIPFSILVSQEFVAVEIVRSLIGAIALVIAVPITTWCATYPLFGFIQKDTSEIHTHVH